MTPSMMSYFGEVTSHCHRIRLSVLGAKDVGKTAIVVRYLTRRFIGEYRSQIDITYRHAVQINNKETCVEIIDFSSKTGEDRIPDMEISMSDSFLVVYSISDRVSFLKAVNIVCVLRAMPSSASAPVTLLGNKSDLDHSRQVSQEELQNIATLFMCERAEVSAAESADDIIPVITDLFQRTSEMSAQSSVTSEDSNSSVTRKKPMSECKSEPSLLHKIKSSNVGSRKRERSLDDNRSDQLHCSVSCQKIDNCYDDSSRCNLCSQHHERPPSSSKASNSPRSVRKRKALKSPPLRTYSLNYKDLRSKSEPRFLINKAQIGRTVLPHSVSESEHGKLDIKKDSRISDFLSCGRAPKGSDHFSYFHQRAAKTESAPSSIASLLLRGRSFTNDNMKFDRSKFSRFSSFRSSNNTGLAKTGNKTESNNANSNIFSTSNPNSLANILPEVKHKTFSINASKPPIKRTPKGSQKPPSPTSPSRTSVEDRFSNFMKKRSQTPTESPTLMSLLSKPPKAFDTHKTPQLPPFMQPSDKRERKFGVFGINALTNVLSRTSLPDLPKATANLYTKFDSFKNTIKKRSV